MSRRLSYSAATLLAAMAGGLAAVTTPTAAQAQFFFGAPFWRPYAFHQRPYYHFARPQFEDEELTPREIVLAVQDFGFRDATRPVFRDDVALLAATNREGRRLRLTVDIYSGRILSAAPIQGPPPRERQAQRAPEQGAAVRRAVPDSRQDARVTPEKPPTTVRREPMLPPQPQTPPRQAQPPRATPERLKPAQQAPAQPPAAKAQPSTPATPRRIEITPPAALDDVKPAPAPARPASPPINSVPPAALE
jgi:hypothetical protein